MSEEEDKIVKNIILNKALHEFKLKKEREYKNKKETASKEDLKQLEAIRKHINELEDLE